MGNGVKSRGSNGQFYPEMHLSGVVAFRMVECTPFCAPRNLIQHGQHVTLKHHLPPHAKRPRYPYLDLGPDERKTERTLPKHVLNLWKNTCRLSKLVTNTSFTTRFQDSPAVHVQFVAQLCAHTHSARRLSRNAPCLRCPSSSKQTLRSDPGVERSRGVY